MKRCIASVGRGKDGLAMLHGPIERGMPLDEVVFYGTGMEFDAARKSCSRTRCPFRRQTAWRRGGPQALPFSFVR